MPPLFLIEPDEQFDYAVGDTVFLYRRILYSERQELLALFLDRGQLDLRGYHKAMIAMGLLGWRNLWGINGEIAWPTPETAAEQRRQVAAILEHLPHDVGVELLTRIQDPAPEALLKNWHERWNGTNGLPTPAPATATPATTADANVPTLASPPPVMPEG